MGLFKKKAKKEPKVIREVNAMSDEEFLEFYKKYYVKSGVRISFGLLLALLGVVLIVILI